jgi:hypothetical protein
MALYYFDASALVKYYILEPGSTWVRHLIATVETGSQPAHMIFVRPYFLSCIVPVAFDSGRRREYSTSSWAM